MTSRLINDLKKSLEHGGCNVIRIPWPQTTFKQPQKLTDLFISFLTCPKARNILMMTAQRFLTEVRWTLLPSYDTEAVFIVPLMVKLSNDNLRFV